MGRGWVEAGRWPGDGRWLSAKVGAVMRQWQDSQSGGGMETGRGRVLARQRCGSGKVVARPDIVEQRPGDHRVHYTWSLSRKNCTKNFIVFKKLLTWVSHDICRGYFILQN